MPRSVSPTLHRMAQPGSRSRIVLAIIWLLLGLAMIGVPLWLGWTRWQAILNGHPAMLAVGILCGLLGFVAVAWSIASLALGDREDREGDPEHPARRTDEQIRRRARWRLALAIPALIACAAMVAVLAWARPFKATPAAAAAMRSENNVVVIDKLGWYEMQPVGKDKSGKPVRPTVALVFVPGARVDPRAYAELLRPLAEAGYVVAVLKAPFGIALARPKQAEEILRVHPEITHWAVGGHSLGGTAAASFADEHEEVKALVLYASYPARPIERTDLKVLSISGSADGLATTADIDASKAYLPPNTLYVVIPGAVHSDFGDYGDQPGDGARTIDREAAQTEIQKATSDLLASLPPPIKTPKK
jgi:pimeloyl-ACP methyl ester carboxylesterase